MKHVSCTFSAFFFIKSLCHFRTTDSKLLIITRKVQSKPWNCWFCSNQKAENSVRNLAMEREHEWVEFGVKLQWNCSHCWNQRHSGLICASSPSGIFVRRPLCTPHVLFTACEMTEALKTTEVFSIHISWFSLHNIIAPGHDSSTQCDL